MLLGAVGRRVQPFTRAWRRSPATPLRPSPSDHVRSALDLPVVGSPGDQARRRYFEIRVIRPRDRSNVRQTYVDAPASQSASDPTIVRQARPSWSSLPKPSPPGDARCQRVQGGARSLRDPSLCSSSQNGARNPHCRPRLHASSAAPRRALYGLSRRLRMSTAASARCPAHRWSDDEGRAVASGSPSKGNP